MKKLITLCLALAGMVGTVSAAKLYIENADPTNWTDIDVYAWEEANTVTNHNVWNIDHDALSTVELYGTTWYVFEMTNNWNRAIVRGNSSNWDDYKTSNLTVESDLYITVVGHDVYRRNYVYPVFRSDLDNNWDSDIENATAENAFTFYREYTKSTIDTWASNNSRSNFSFRFKAGYDFGGGFWPQIYPNSVNAELPIGSTLNSSYENTENTTYCWQVSIPSYDYEKIRLTAAYRKVDGDWKWQISADAYFSKTVYADNGYATFGTSVPVDLSGLSAKGVTAYTVTADATSRVITKNKKSDALDANEGVLLQNTSGYDVTLSIPVAASAEASASNSMVAFTGTERLTQPTSGNETYYILANNEGDGVGFYKVNTTSGNAMGANTAYLKVTGSLARPYLWFDEATGIDAVESAKPDGEAYNLAGQRVAQPTKGLYIVNGKKVIMK